MVSPRFTWQSSNSLRNTPTSCAGFKSCGRIVSLLRGVGRWAPLVRRQRKPVEILPVLVLEIDLQGGQQAHGRAIRANRDEEVDELFVVEMPAQFSKSLIGEL